MSLQLPNAPSQYDSSNESRARAAIQQADAQNLKRQADIVGSRLILRSPNGTVYQIVVANDGTLSSMPVTL